MVLLHGGLGSGEMFGPTLPALAAGHRVIVVDLQGLFRSGWMARQTRAAVRVGFANAREFAPLPEPNALAATMRILGDAIYPWVAQDRYVDFMVLLPGQSMEEQIKSRGLPVYRRLFEK